MYTLYGSPTNRSFRVLWMLEELGADYKLEPISPHSPEADKLNPTGKVPILIDDEVEGSPPLIDSAAILQYLADKHGKFTAPSGTFARAQQNSMTQFVLDDVESPLWVLAKHKFILPEELRQDGIRPACEHDYNRALKALEVRLGDHKWLMGDEFTVPDIILVHSMGWANSIKFELPKGKLTDYTQRAMARDAFKRAAAIREEKK